MRSQLSKWAKLFCFTVVLYFAGSSSGATVQLTQISGWDYGQSAAGGPFQANVSGLTGYSGPSSFVTFCVEDAEEFSFGTTYDPVISDRAVFGMNGQDGPGYDILSSQTAYLYSHFRAGDLGTLLHAFNPSISAVFDTASADMPNMYALQFAIWRFEGETATPTNSLSNALTALANANANGTQYNVRVMQMWEYGGDANPGKYVGQVGYQHQDQLILVPTPSGFFAGMSIFAAFTLVGWIKRQPKPAL